MKKTLIAIILLAACQYSMGQEVFGNISRTNLVWTAATLPVTHTVDEATTSRTLSTNDVCAYIRLTGLATAINVPSNSVVDWASFDVTPTIFFRVATTNMPTFSGGLTVGAGINDPKGIVAALDEDGDTFGIIWVGTNSFDVF